MRYAEVERKLKKAGCYDTGGEINGHPAWYSPITEQYFKMGHHKNQEVATGTLKGISKSSGVKL